MRFLPLPLTCLAVILAVSLTGGSPSADGRLTVELIDAETGRSVPGLIRVLGPDGGTVALDGLLSRGQGLKSQAISRWSVLMKRTTLKVPRGKLTVEAFHGIETTVARATADLSAEASVGLRIPLRRIYNPDARGWRNGNTHIHLRNLTTEQMHRHLWEIPNADGLDVAFLSHLERADDDRSYISNSLTQADLDALSGSGILFCNGQEHRHNFKGFGQGYGHVMFLNIHKLVQPVSIGPGIMKKGTDGIPLQRGIDEIRDHGGTVIWCHNTFGYEDIPNWFTGRVHAQNIFDGGAHGEYKDTFYRYLNAALRVPFSTGTDWFIYDFSRVYVQVPELNTPEDLLQGLREGRSYITNGTFLEFSVNGRSIGDTLKLKGPGRVRVKGRAVGRDDFKHLELVGNGRMLFRAESRSRDGVFGAEIDFEVEVEEPCWLALRIPPPREGTPRNAYGRPLFAHTSPVYVHVGGRTIFHPSVVRALIEETRKNRKLIADKALFADDAERRRVLHVYDDALRSMEEMIK